MLVLPVDQIKAVFSQEMCDIEPCFLGFTDVYKHLAQIIPKHFTVIDFGCAYNPQCYYFLEHRKYIAVDPGESVRFKSPNCTIYEATTEQWIKEHLSKINIHETFAICSYVPPWYGHQSHELVRQNFINVFTYYPHGGYGPLKELIRQE
jgi:hypothetical protein